MAGLVACLAFVINLFFLAIITEPFGPFEHVSTTALLIGLIWIFTIPIVAAVFAFRLVVPKERLCDICGKPIPNDAVDWMQRIGKDGEAKLWVPTHADCSTESHQIK